MKIKMVVLFLLMVTFAYADRSGVLFYAGFDGTADAVAVGDGKAQGHEGGPKFMPGKRGEALLSGDGDGYVSYAVERNILIEQGSIEFWVCPIDWEGTDEKFHVFFEASNPGWILVYKYWTPGSGLFLISEARQTWSTAGQDLSNFKPGEWHHMVVTWSRREICFYLDGKPSGRVGQPQIPLGLSGRFLVGDRPWHFKRNARSLLDELYIYDRALTEKEAVWAYEQWKDRAPGEDVPEALTPLLQMGVYPLPSKRQICVRVEVSRRHKLKRFTGRAWIEPAAGTVPAPIRMIAEGVGTAVIPFTDLPRGEYEVRVLLKDGQGKEVGTASERLISPGPPIWRGNKIGIPKKPPPPWTPVRIRNAKFGKRREPMEKSGCLFECWGRTYQLGALGLPTQITSAGAPLLVAPVELRVVCGGKLVSWNAEALSLLERSDVKVRLRGSAVSELGKLEWICTGEFDGMLRYDLRLHPLLNASVDKMELRFRLNPSSATLHYLFLGYPIRTLRGATPKGERIVFKANWAGYWWLGDEERGLAGFCESDEAWDRVDRDDGFRIERTTQAVEVVWSFADEPRKLDKDWNFTFGLQATPVKDITGWRKWRLMPALNANVYILWSSPDIIRYFGYPEATDQQKYRALVKDYHIKGIKVVPYSNIMGISSQAPEWRFYGEEWANGAMDASSSDVMAYNRAPFMGCSPAPDWVDFIVWANERYVRQLDLDGLYHDWTGVYPSTNQLSRCGYLRDGKVRPTYPIFATRELYKRIYTMLKEHGKAMGKETFMMGHMSTQMIIPILSFCDAYLDAEHFRGQVKDNYLEVAPLDHLRAEFMGHNYGVMPFFLPEFTGEYATKPEPTQHLIGLSLLHDFALWAIWCKTEEVSRVYEVLDEFGVIEAQFLPYWKNAHIIGGQSEAVKSSVYRKPNGGSLVVIVNLTREIQKPTLTIDWEKLKSPGQLSVIEGLSKEAIPVQGESITVELKPLNFSLLWVR